MEKNKNILIGGLLAIVLIMAVGYAAFATQLQINGEAKITSTWDVHFKENNKAYVASTTGTGSEPGATMERTSATLYTITADLKQPGDKVVYTFTVENAGNLAASLTDLKLSSEGNGIIKFTLDKPSSSTLAANGGTQTFTLTAEYTNTSATLTDEQKTATTNITFTANQA